MGNKTTIIDVAEKAGVSIGTVSRVLNDPDYHASEMVARVRAAIAATGFMPRRHKKRRKPVGVNQFAMLFPTSEDGRDGMVTPLGNFLALGASELFAEQCDQMLITQLRPGVELPICISERQVAGVIARAGPYTEEMMDLLGTLPCVWLLQVHCRKQSMEMDMVSVDNYRMGWLAAETLAATGRPRVILLRDNTERNVEISNRSLVCEGALREKGIPCETVTLSQLADAVSSRGPDSVSVYIPGHDSEIELAHRALSSCGLKPCAEVPLVCSVTSVPRIAAIDSRILCLSIEPVAIGRTAAELLQWRIQNPQAPVRTILVPPRLVLPAKAA